MYAYIGLEDDNMSPILRPGSLVMIDEERRHVLDGEWANEHERPIYFVELRDRYICSWCQVRDSLLTVVPYPTSKAQVRTFSLADEAEVVGQVVSVAMRLNLPTPTTRAQGITPPARS
jgi:hypothetical protein